MSVKLLLGDDFRTGFDEMIPDADAGVTIS
jgi:hypothetical protein